MKIRFLLALFTAACLLASPTYAQPPEEEEHSDVEIGYEFDEFDNPTRLLFFDVNEFTSDGIAFFEAGFENKNRAFDDDPVDWVGGDPGFETAPGETITENHQIWLTLLDASTNSEFGKGHLNFFDPSDPANTSLEAAGNLVVSAQDPSSSMVVEGLRIEDGDIVSGSMQQFIQAGRLNNTIHDHATFDLLDDANAPIGAYGMLFQLESHFDAFERGSPDLVSDKFWIVLNRGMDEEEFETRAVRAFGIAAVPEPTSAVLILAGIAGLGMKRRRVA